MAKPKEMQAVVSLAGKVDPSLDKAMRDVQGRLEGVNVKALAVGAAIGTAIGAGVAQGTKYLVELGDSYNTALNGLKAQTGATAAEMEGLSDVIQNIYKSGYGEAFGDVADGVAQISKTTKLVGEDLEEVTKGAFALQETFGYEIPESARAAKAMITNFGISGQEAMNLIAAGAQNGLDYSGELIDSINEYSVQFSKLGFTAEDMFKIYQEGAENGAWNLDKVGDAIKEFSIRSIDGSTTSQEAFEALGYDAETMFQTFTQGGDEASTAFHEVINRLMDMDDHVARDAAGVGLFGTMWEDLGTEAMQALADMQAGAYATGKELSGIQEIRYDNIGEAFKVIGRILEVGLLPVASQFANTLMDAAPKIAETAEKAIPVITGVAGAVLPVVSAVIALSADGIGFLTENMDILIPVVVGLTAAFGVYEAAVLASNIANKGGIPAILASTKAKISDKIVTAQLGLMYAKDAVVKGVSTAATKTWTLASKAATLTTKGLGVAFRFLTGPVGLVITAIGAVVGAGIALYKNWDTVKLKAMELGAYLGAIWSNVSNGVSNMINMVGQYFPIFGGLLTGWWTSIQDVVGNVKGIFYGVIDFISNVFAGNWSAAWGNVIDIFGNLFGGIVNIAKIPINGVVGSINAVLDGINGAGFTIPDWVPVVGGKSFNLDIPRIPMLAAGGFTSGLSIAGEAGTEAVISFDPAHRSENLSYWAKAGQMLGADTEGYNLGGGSMNKTTVDLGGVVFSPNITVTGNADEGDIMRAIRNAYPEFIDLLEKWAGERGEFVYG